MNLLENYSSDENDSLEEPSSKRICQESGETDGFPEFPVDPALEARVHELVNLLKEGRSLKKELENQKDHQNPYLLSEIAKSLHIDMYGSRMPEDQEFPRLRTLYEKTSTPVRVLPCEYSPKDWSSTSKS